MTPRKVESLKKKIQKIKAALAADKRRWGGMYDDSRGLRYLPPALFLQLQDYAGAIKYFRWFHKNFPDDVGYPIFLFEWTVTLFKTSDKKGAEKKALQTFFANTYLFDKFLGKPHLDLGIYTHSNWQEASLTEALPYSKDQAELADFVDWVSQFLTSDRFYTIANEFVDIERRLTTEPVGPARSALVARRYSLLDDFA